MRLTKQREIDGEKTMSKRVKWRRGEDERQRERESRERETEIREGEDEEEEAGMEFWEEKGWVLYWEMRREKRPDVHWSGGLFDFFLWHKTTKRKRSSGFKIAVSRCSVSLRLQT